MATPDSVGDDGSSSKDSSSIESELSRLRQRCEELERDNEDLAESNVQLMTEIETDHDAFAGERIILEEKIVRLEREKDHWQSKYLDAQKTQNLEIGTLQRELDEVKAEKERYRVSLRDTEMGVDDLERSERMKASELADEKARYNQAIEDKTMLEQELIGKIQVEEELQRLKDELNDIYIEVSVLKQKLDRAPPSPTRSITPPPVLPSRAPTSRAPPLQRQSSADRAAQQPQMSPVKESSRELSISDLTFLGDTPNGALNSSPFAAQHRNEDDDVSDDGLSPSPSMAGLPPLHSPPPPLVRGPASPLPRSTSSPVFARLGAPISSSRATPLPGSPSALPRSMTGRNLNGPLSRAAPASPRSPAVVRPRQPMPARTLAAAAAPSTKSRGVRMVSDLGERVRTLQHRMGTHRGPVAVAARRHAPLPPTPDRTASSSRASSRTSSSLRDAASDARPPPANARMRALTADDQPRASGSNGPLTPGTPGTPGTGDWVMVSDAENSPTPAPTNNRPPSPQPPPRPRSSLAGGLRLSTRSSAKASSSTLPTATLPSRPGIPSPLASSATRSELQQPTRRPSSRFGEHRPSSSLGQNPPPRPITPSSLPVPRRSLSSSRPASPAPGSSSITFPSTSFAGSSAVDRSSISRPRPLGSSTRAAQPVSTFGSTSGPPSSDVVASALKRSSRRTSLVDSAVPSPPPAAPATSSLSSTHYRIPTPRSSLGTSSSSRSRPVSMPVQPRDAPPVPIVPSHLAGKRHAIILPPGSRPALGRKRSSTGGSDGALLGGYQP